MRRQRTNLGTAAARGQASPVPRAVLLALLIVFGSTTLAGCLTTSDDGPEGALEPGDNNDPQDPSRTHGPADGDARDRTSSSNGTNGSIYAPGWPSLGDAVVRPGVGILAWDGHTGQRSAYACTSNFLFQSPDNRSLYLGTAAHCTDDLDINDTVEIAGGQATGTLIYSSSKVMDSKGESERYNDLALVRIDDEYRHLVHPAVLHYGGPTGLADSSRVDEGDAVATFGNSSLRRPVLNGLDPREGLISGADGDWRLGAIFQHPGVPGDSGSPVIDEEGQALAVLTTLGVAVSSPGLNGIARLDSMLTYLQESVSLNVTLVTWDRLEPVSLLPTPQGGTDGSLGGIASPGSMS